MAFSLLAIFPVALLSGTVSAQTSGYNIDKVDHQVQIMYSGHVIISDTIHVSGQITDGFMIGLPYKYSADVLKGLAYDDTHVYQLNLGVQLGDHSGFYGATVDFNGNSPSVFTVAFVLSNQLITEQGSGVFSLDFPSYPSLAKDVGTCNVTITFPSSPTSVNITKNDGNINDAVYTKTNLPAYTYAPAIGTFQIPIGPLQLTTISSLNRQITVDPARKVSVSDSYRIISNSTSLLNSFVFTLPRDATNVVVRDQFVTLAANLVSSVSGNILMANATLVTFLANGQSTVLTVQYNLPSAMLQGSTYVLADFKLFPDFVYYVDHATVTFTPPEGATIVTPQAALLDSSSTLTRDIYQEILTVTKYGLSYVDYLVPQQNDVQVSFDYSPVWVSFRLTFWSSFLTAVGCLAVFFVRRRQEPKEETYADKTEHLSTLEGAPITSKRQKKGSDLETRQHASSNNIKEFIDAYEDKKQLNAEIKSMDSKAQKGKIPRRQYKVQRRALQIRLEGINRNIERTKETFRGSTGGYADLIKQMDLAEADLFDAEENLKNLESRQSTGEISLEVYKRNIGDLQTRKDKAESAINKILLRLREKLR